jgi:cobalt-zinc-cadmium efflux system membrane fusion protein
MKNKVPILVALIIGIGIFLAILILKMDRQKIIQPHDHHEDQHSHGEDQHNHANEKNSTTNLTKQDPLPGWEYSQINARAKFFPEEIKSLNISVSKAGPAQIKIIQKLTGEVSLNEEKVAHIVPRLDGVVKKVFKDLGDRVENGELLAILESRELADVKISYLSALKKSKLSLKDLEREKLVYKNTLIMLRLLGQHSDLNDIELQLNSLVIGESRKLVIPAYSKFQLADSVYKREKLLYEKGISSKSEYLLSLEDYKSAEAKYLALREKISYDGDWAIRQKLRTFEMDQLELQTTNQKLQALGLSSTQIQLLETQKNPILTQYELRSSLSGLVVKRHLTIGEAIKKDANIFILADLSDVWVNISIPANKIKAVKLGQKVRVINKPMGIENTGRLTYLSSIIDKKNRTITGRVVIPNRKKLWRPGTFVDVELILEQRSVSIAINPKAIQNLREWSVVFVKNGNFFEGRPVELGISNSTWVEVLNGLSAGEEYALKNSFVIKAEIEKSGATHSH